jgi:uncharacterized glyoxalase superfamily protein PhnB
MSQSIQPVPPGFSTLTPHITVAGGARAIEFYKRAFGAEEVSTTPGPGGVILNAMLRIGDSILMLNDPPPEDPTLVAPAPSDSTSVVLHVYTADCDELFARAEKAGATVVLPLTDMFWGDRYGMLRDPFGHMWSIAMRIEEPTPEEIGRRMAEQATQR